MSRQFPVVRGLAIFLVVLNHSISMSLWMTEKQGGIPAEHFLFPFLVTIKQLGLYSVPIFLFLSGAFFSYAFGSQPQRNIPRMVWNNILIVVRPYLLWSLIFYIVLWLVVGEPVNLLESAKNLLVGYPYDFIPLLIFFYLIAPFLTIAIKRWPVQTLTLLFAYQLLTAAIVIPGLLGGRLPEWINLFGLPIVRKGIAYKGIFFPLGIAFHLYTPRILPLLKRARLLLLGGGLVCYVLNILTELEIIQVPLSAILTPILAVLVTLLLKREQFPFYKWLENLGKRSYGLYLTNLVILVLLLYGLRLAAPWLLGVYAIQVPLLVILVLGINRALVYVFEHPPQRALYRYIFG